MTSSYAIDLAPEEAGRQPPPRRALRGLLQTIIVYLAVAALSGVSYAICAMAWNGSTIVRVWLAAIVPVAIYLIARTIVFWCRRLLAREQQLDLFKS